MQEYEKTNHHIVICSANYLRLKKILKNYDLNDNFDLNNSHFYPALIRKIYLNGE